VGMEGIDSTDGVETLDRLLGMHEGRVAVLRTTSWEKFISRRLRGTAAFLSQLARTNFQERDTKSNGKGIQQEQQYEHFFEVLHSAASEDRRSTLEEHLRQQALKILSLPPHTRINENEAFHDLGLDSLMAVELRNALAATLERPLSPTLVLDYPTLRTLTDFLLQEMFPAPAPPSVGGILPDSVANISDEEAEALLLEELERGELGAKR
jgi:acyl carrier protein